MHGFELSDEQTMVQETVRKLVREDIGPSALAHDEHRSFARGGFEQLAEMGFLGLPVSEDAGGAGMGMVAFAIALEELAKGCGSTARLVLVHAGLSGLALEGLEAGGELIENIVTGGKLVSFIGPESKIMAVGDELTGVVPMATAAMEADLFLVAATGEEPGLFVVSSDKVERRDVAALGFRASAPGEVTFAGQGARIASGSDAKAATERATLAACVGGGAIATGLATASFELALVHAHDRVAFGKPLFRQQAVGHKLVEGLRQFHAARHLVYRAAELVDAGSDTALQASMLAKLDAVEAAVLGADEAIQIHGGFGFTVEYHVERHYRDAKTLEVLDHGADWLRDQLTETIALR